MSLCDSCYAPGQCCKRLRISKSDGEPTVWLDDPNEPMIRQGLPFRYLDTVQQWTDQESGRAYGFVTWMCPALGPDGRCTIYEQRPKLCRTYEPRSDPLCVHWSGAEGGESAEPVL